MWSVFFVFLSYLDRNFVRGEFLNYSLDGEKEGKSMFLMLNGTFCAKMSAIGENDLYQVSDGVEEVRSVRDPAGKLVDCSVTVNQMQVKSFMHVCRLGLKDQTTKLGHFETSFAHLEGAKADCQEFQRKTEQKRVGQKMKVNSSSNKEKVLSRSKRGFTYPGTLWCGAGNMADDVNQLGVFAETDNCCRVHDHCPHVIHAFSSNYGYTNFKWLSISHCDCDNAMKECLRKVNDSSSRVVGQAFFNVMEVPCFEFTYEEQCVERHWYGMCKKFERMPVAVAKQSIPYDFGGIDVIDVLTLAPPKNKESDKSGQEQVRPEGPTEPPVSGSQTTGPEEPSLSNVVTAAEDFIKVLATVSTSQSSTTEAAKGEAQSAEKKKKKNLEKKKNKKKKAKGRGRKRKQRVESISKAEETAPGTPTSSKAEEVINKSDFVDEPSKVFQLNRNVNDLIDIDLGGREEPSNDVMKDQPMTDEENASIATSITTTTPVKEKEDSQAHTVTKQTALLSVTIRIPTTMQQKRQRSSKGRKKHNCISPTSSPEPATTHTAVDQELPVKTTDTSGVQSSNPPIPSDQLEQQRLGPTTITARTPIVIPFKRKRHRSKDRKNRNKRRRIGFSSPIEEAQHSSKDEFRAITGSSATTTVKTATDLESHRPENDRDWSPLTTSTTATTTVSTSTTATIATTRATATSAAISSTTTTATSSLNTHQNKRQQSKEREGRKRRKKLVLPLLADATSPQSASEETMSVPSATDSPSGLTVLPISTMGLFAVGKDGKHGRLTATAGTPVLTARGHRSREGERKKRRKKNSPAINPSDDNEPDARNKTTARLRLQTTSSDMAEIEELKDSTEQVLYAAQPSTPSMSLIQSILQKAEEQLDWKRRRKNKAPS